MERYEFHMIPLGDCWKAGGWEVRLSDWTFSAQLEIYIFTSSFCIENYTNMTFEHWLSGSSPAVSVFIIRAMKVVNYTRHTAITQELSFIVKLKFDQMTSR